jgi:hypothetical protein
MGFRLLSRRIERRGVGFIRATTDKRSTASEVKDVLQLAWTSDAKSA